MKTDLRYQNGSLYQHHGAWYVRYRQRISKEDGSCNLNHASKHLGRSKDFRNISDVELCRASFMQTVNRDRLSANSRITLTAFVEGAYLPWAKEERRVHQNKRFAPARYPQFARRIPRNQNLPELALAEGDSKLR
jgi:hypothetical protein